jgi:hypothetical protein
MARESPPIPFWTVLDIPFTPFYPPTLYTMITSISRPYDISYGIEMLMTLFFVFEFKIRDDQIHVTSLYFPSAMSIRAPRKGENYELSVDLNSEYRDKRKDAIKRTIASMTVGKGEKDQLIYSFR